MPNTKTYLNVPYAEKDAAKALGARWDAANKKWYAPANIDIQLLAKWHAADDSATQPGKTKAASKPGAGVFTQPGIKDFVAYNGDLPPWD